jgi:hypothetical protein
MNASVGGNSPDWLCLEARRFSTREREDAEEQEVTPIIQNGWEVAKDICEEYGLSYSAFKHAHDRGKVAAEVVEGRLCVKREELDQFARIPRKRGKPTTS